MKVKDGCTITATPDGGGVILDTQGGTYWQVNRAGLTLLHGVAEGKTEAELLNGVRNMYPNMADVAMADAVEMISQFRDEGLVSGE